MATIDPNQSNGGLVPAVPSPVASPSVDAGAAIPTGAGQQTEATGPAFAFFTPSFDLALAAAVISMALVVIHLGLTLRKRTMFFGPVMTMASLRKEHQTLEHQRNAVNMTSTASVRGWHDLKADNGDGS